MPSGREPGLSQTLVNPGWIQVKGTSYLSHCISKTAVNFPSSAGLMALGFRRLPGVQTETAGLWQLWVTATTGGLR